VAAANYWRPALATATCSRSAGTVLAQVTLSAFHVPAPVQPLALRAYPACGSLGIR
jgi:hypothetical protein